ncbi:class I SAM-dependent methyltransferase [Phenylobacterium sp.]|jgi:16S rRNA (guanine1207-N2)-methyltransferase|uniref:class I SAM-dependent methyltransferase n=1 Tax=Phenylobacterium sp. TaxID=1871053 RepID=UPI002F930948
MASVVYGDPPADLVERPAGAVQVSPLVPGAASLEDRAAASLDAVAMAAPPGTLERRYALALALRALKPGAPLTALAPKDKGGSRIGRELAAFGCKVEEEGRRHQRICRTVRPPEPVGVEAAIAEGEPRRDGELWTQPGVFSWDRLDPGSRLLLSALPPLKGRGVDLGCGIGVLSRAVLASPAVTRLDLVEIDRRALEAARRNVMDERAQFHWADARTAPELDGLDFVVTNPPFHEGGNEDRALGLAFLRRAHRALRKGGVLWVVANRHLPYEALLAELFGKPVLKADSGGFKVYEARK